MRKNKVLAVLVSIALVLICSVGATAIVAEADTTYVIVKSKDATAVENNAAETFQKYWKQITNEELSIVTDDRQESEKEIVIGNTTRQSPSVEQVNKNGYLIKSEGKKLFIVGEGGGTLYGVYAFLEKYCDCDWYVSSEYHIPQNVNLIVPTDADIKYNPYFEYTDLDWVSPRDKEYSLANGLNGGVYRNLSEAQGGTVNYISWFGHTLSTQFCSASTYFSEHPEYFALHEGKRSDKQLCLTNEDTFNIVLNEVKELLRNKHDPNAPIQIISLTQNDNEEFCECENCKKIDEEKHSHAGTMIAFVNRIAAEIKEEPSYDNVAIDTFAYRYTRTVPTNIVPLDNVIVRLCSIECCFGHTFEDKACKENRSFMSDLEGWSEISTRLYVWDYATNYANTLGIFPDFGVLQRNMQILYEHNVKGVYSEGNYYMSSCDTEFGELRSYLISKLLQNPYCDYYSYMDEFLEAYYGAGWKNIREFINMTIEKPGKDGHISIYASMQETLSFDKDDVKKADELWEAAINESTSDIYTARIKRSQLSWRFWKGSNLVAEFAITQMDRPQRNIDLYNDIIASGATAFKETKWDMNVPNWFAIMRPENWDDDLPFLPYLFYNVPIKTWAIATGVTVGIFTILCICAAG